MQKPGRLERPGSIKFNFFLPSYLLAGLLAFAAALAGAFMGLAAFAIAFAAFAIAFAAFAIAFAAALAVLAIALAAFIAFASALFALVAVFEAASPQAIPSAPITRTADSAITFFITSIFLLSSAKIRSNFVAKRFFNKAFGSYIFLLGTFDNIVTIGV